MENIRRNVPILLVTLLLWLSSGGLALAGPIIVLNPNFATVRACACFPCPTHFCYRCTPGCTTHGWQPGIHGGFCLSKFKCKLFSTEVCSANNACGHEIITGSNGCVCLPAGCPCFPARKLPKNTLESISRYTSGATKCGEAFLCVEQCLAGFVVGDRVTVHFTACSFSLPDCLDKGGNTSENVGVKFFFCPCCFTNKFCFQHGAIRIDNNAVCCGGICTPGTICNFSFTFIAKKPTYQLRFSESAASEAGATAGSDALADIIGAHITITQASTAPEIDANAVTAPLAALLGVLAILADRRVRRV